MKHLPRRLLLFCFLAGCSSGPAHYPVTGVVTLEGQAQDDAVVRFLPIGDTPGHGGTGVSDGAGKFEVTAAQTNRKGLPAGSYRVIISRMRRPDGSKPDPNVPPIESDASEKIPAPYSSQRDSTLKATVGAEPTVVDFHLPIKK